MKKKREREKERKRQVVRMNERDRGETEKY